MMLEGLGAYLATQPGLGPVGTTIFLGWMPDAPDENVTLYEPGGAANIRVRDGLDLGVEQPTIAAITRATTYEAARTLAQNVYMACTGIDNVNMSDAFWLWLQPLHPPIYAGRDSKDRVTFNVNFHGQRTPPHA